MNKLLIAPLVLGNAGSVFKTRNSHLTKLAKLGPAGIIRVYVTYYLTNVLENISGREFDDY
jgi:uncharacterized membrane protein